MTLREMFHSLRTRLIDAVALRPGWRHPGCWLAILILCGLAVRLWGLGVWGLWNDEANTVLIAREDWPAILRRLRYDSNPPLYYFLMHGWIRLWGSAPWAAQSLSAVIGAASIGMVWRIGRHEAGARAGWLAAVFLAAAPYHVYYSQEARMYTLLPLLAILSVWTWHRATLEPRRRGWWLGYVASTCAALYTHHFGLWLLPTAAVYNVVYVRERHVWARWMAALLLIGLAYLPWIPTLLYQMAHPGHYLWLASRLGDMRHDMLGMIWQSLETLMIGGIFPPTEALFQHAQAPLGTIAIHAGVWGWLFWKVRSAPPAREQARWLAMLLLSVAVPLVCAAVYSVARHPILTMGRVDSIALPALVLMTAWGASVIRRRVVAVIIVSLLLATPAWQLVRYYHTPHPLRAKELSMVNELRRGVAPGDVIVCTAYTCSGVYYAVWQYGLRVPVVPFPEKLSRNPAVFNLRRLAQRESEVLREADALPQALLPRLKANGRVWVTTYAAISQHPPDRFTRRAVQQLRARFPGRVRLVHWQSPASRK